MNTTRLSASGKAGLLAATLLLSFSSCAPYMGYGNGYGNGYGYGGGYYGGGYGGYGYPSGLTAFIPTGNNYNYSYYPRYGAYYHRPTGQYHYMSGNRWLSGTSLPGYSPRVIQASHSVPFNFNSHPSNYHSQVSHSFPRSWSPPSGGGHSSGGWGGSGGGSHGSSHGGGSWGGGGSGGGSWGGGGSGGGSHGGGSHGGGHDHR